jgi:hypothetical protein
MTEFISGYIWPGQPICNIMFKVSGAVRVLWRAGADCFLFPRRSRSSDMQVAPSYCVNDLLALLIPFALVFARPLQMTLVG